MGSEPDGMPSYNNLWGFKYPSLEKRKSKKNLPISPEIRTLGEEKRKRTFCFYSFSGISVQFQHFFNLQLMLTIRMKQHLDPKTLKLCHLEKVKRFSKHFHPIFFSNWNSSNPTFSHEFVLSQLAFSEARCYLRDLLTSPRGQSFLFVTSLPLV